MLLTIGGFLTMLFSCAKLPPLERKDLVGEWKSDMNEVLILYADSTFVAKNIAMSTNTAKLVFGDASEMRIGGKGTWRIYKNNIDLLFICFVRKSETIEKRQGLPLSVKGSGLFENRLPWKIISDIGDVDVSSTFKKVE